MKLIDLEPGIYDNVPAEVYHERVMGVVNTGVIKLLNSSTPAHYAAWLESTESMDTPALVFGRAFHEYVLEPETFHDRFAVSPKCDRRTKEGKAMWEAFQLSGKQVIESDELIRLEGMRQSVMKHPIASALLTDGKPEVTFIWVDPSTGLLCKCRADYWREDIVVIVDLKSTEDASPKAFAKSVVNFGYHVQNAHYEEGLRVLLGKRPQFAFIVVEKKPPYAVAVYVLDAEAIDRGHELRSRAMATLDECMKSDSFPGYDTAIQTLSLPNWAYQD